MYDLCWKRFHFATRCINNYFLKSRLSEPHHIHLHISFLFVDDEDTVKETPAPKVTAGAAQAATQPGDIQMHVHNDHGTGGHWCAKVVFFILLTGLGALIGLIILENRGVSNADTPLSESRYAEYFDGWVDENREDDHHHEEILEALNQLDEHEDEDEAHGEADDHGDEEDEDDGAPYAEEEDHDDERDLQDEEDEGELPKLDDDEVEEIVATEKKVAQQEARAAADNDDDDDGKLKLFIGAIASSLESPTYNYEIRALRIC